ncbi:MAG TPA: hypothetical protein PLO65_06515 [Caulobacter sp.]|nr:hypothetical protein [Caulobacter sp.]
MLSPWPWVGALVVYLLFRAWYDNWRGPLTAAEVAAFMARVEAGPGAAHNDPAIVRAFLEADDGREFFMFNLVKIATGEAPHPETGAPTPRARLMRRYTRTFIPALLARGGHPALAARKIAGYVDAWKVGPDPGWSIIGYMRYRSRRDMIAMATHPKFQGIHDFKIAGTAETFSFPTRPMLMLLAPPRLWVALVLLLAAAFAQIALLVP